MSKVTVLGSEDIKKLITIPMALEAVEGAYAQKSRGEGGLWPMVFHEFDPGKADLDIKSGDLGQTGYFGFKLVSWFGANPDKGLPALFGTAMLFDISTGAPCALLNAGGITAYRTGAAAAIGAKYLARADAETLLICGCGELAPYLAAAALYALPQIRSVKLINPHHPEKTAAAVPAIAAEVDALLAACDAARTAEISPAAGLEAAVGESDIIFTATPARAPYIKSAWVKPGTHLSCIGADMSGKEEVEPSLCAKARVFGDDAAQCFAVGECEIPHSLGMLDALAGEIGGVITGAALGRVGAEDITLFDSTGIALQDIACSCALLTAAEKAGLGTAVEL